MKLSAKGSLHAMHRPNVRQKSLKWLVFTGCQSRVAKIGSPAWRKPLDMTVERRHHSITVRDRQRTAGTKIVLHVDDDECAFLSIDFDYKGCYVCIGFAIARQYCASRFPKTI